MFVKKDVRNTGRQGITAWTNLVEFLDSLNNNVNTVSALPEMANLPAACTLLRCKRGVFSCL